MQPHSLSRRARRYYWLATPANPDLGRVYSPAAHQSVLPSTRFSTSALFASACSTSTLCCCPCCCSCI